MSLVNPPHLHINILSYFFFVFPKCTHKHDCWFWVFELLSKILIILYSLLGFVFDSMVKILFSDIVSEYSCTIIFLSKLILLIF